MLVRWTKILKANFTKHGIGNERKVLTLKCA